MKVVYHASCTQLTVNDLVTKKDFDATRRLFLFGNYAGSSSLRYIVCSVVRNMIETAPEPWQQTAGDRRTLVCYL